MTSRFEMSGMTNPGQLTEIEARKFINLLYLQSRHGDMAFFLYERGAIDEERLRSAMSILAGSMGEPYVQMFWASHQVNFVKS